MQISVLFLIVVCAIYLFYVLRFVFFLHSQRMMVVSMITCTTGSVDKYLEFLSPCLASRLHSCFGRANILFSAHRMWWDFCFGPKYMESFLSTDFFFRGVFVCWYVNIWSHLCAGDKGWQWHGDCSVGSWVSVCDWLSSNVLSKRQLECLALLTNFVNFLKPCFLVMNCP